MTAPSDATAVAVARFAAYLESGVGREKLCRTVQFTCKLVSWYFARDSDIAASHNSASVSLSSPPPPSLTSINVVAGVVGLGGIMGSTRKALRFGQALTAYAKCRAAATALRCSGGDCDGGVGVVVRARTFVHTMAQLLYLLSDHAAFARGCGFLPGVGGSAYHTRQLDRVVDGWWLVTVVMSLWTTADDLRRVNDQLRQLNTLSSSSSCGDADERRRRRLALCARRNALHINTVRLLCDLFVASAGADVHVFGSRVLNVSRALPIPVLAVMGMTSSLIGGWQAYPSAVSSTAAAK